MDIVMSVVNVLIVGLVLGAGLPAVFAFGMRLVAEGTAGVHVDGTATSAKPVLRYLGYLLFAFVALVIVVGILWLTRQTIYFHTGVQIFPDRFYK